MSLSSVIASEAYPATAGGAARKVEGLSFVVRFTTRLGHKKTKLSSLALYLPAKYPVSNFVPLENLVLLAAAAV